MVVAEVTRGGPRDATVNRVLKLVGSVTAVTESTARMAGRLLAAAEMEATVDALVVAEAARGDRTAVLTGDPGDLSRLAANLPGVRIRAI